MIKTNVFVLAALCMLFSGGIHADKIKGNGKIVTKEVKVGDYESINVGGNILHENWGIASKSGQAFKFHYSQQSGKSGLTISIDENLFPLLDISSSDGVLLIKQQNKDDKLYPTEFTVKGSSENLRKVSLSGVMHFIVETPLKSDDLKISVSGTGNVVMDKRAEIGSLKASISGTGDVSAANLTCDQLDGSISGVGSLKLKGNAEKAKLSVSGKSDIDAYDFAVKEMSASVSGVGNLKVHASSKLNASVSGIGNISYKGNPEDVKVQKSGMGSISKKGD